MPTPGLTTVRYAHSPIAQCDPPLQRTVPRRRDISHYFATGIQGLPHGQESDRSHMRARTPCPPRWPSPLPCGPGRRPCGGHDLSPPPWPCASPRRTPGPPPPPSRFPPRRASTSPPGPARSAPPEAGLARSSRSRCAPRNLHPRNARPASTSTTPPAQDPKITYRTPGRPPAPP